MKYFLSFLCYAMVFYLTSCNKNPKAKLIVGKWEGIEWQREGSPANLNAEATNFNFDTEGNYTYNYQSNNETGTYKVENDMLFTTPEGGLEIMVKIAKLNADTLVFDMSRSGISESLVLVKKK